MKMYRYILEPYRTPASRYRCPQCHQKHTFSRYIDTETGHHLASHVGRCSRESKCAYHFKPGEFLGKSIVHGPWSIVRKLPVQVSSFMDGKQEPNTKATMDYGPWTMAFPQAPPAMDYGPSTMDLSPSTMDLKPFTQSLSHYEKNNFTNWLITLFGDDITAGLIARYLIGTSKHWPGATVFWQVDGAGSIRTGKIMLYGPNGKRVKKPFNYITWAHCLVSSGQYSVGSEQLAAGDKFTVGGLQLARGIKQTTANCPLQTANFLLKQCLFGEHLLNEEPNKPVAIVESEKSAIIASVYLPHFVWLAAGSLSNLSAQKCAVLKGRNVTLFPDLNAFDKWQLKAKELKFKVSSLLEDNATEAEITAGLDVADYLLQFNCDAFRAGVGAGERAESGKTKAESTEKLEESGIALSLDDPGAIVRLFSGSFNVDESSIRYDYKPILKPVKWDGEIDELQAYFDGITLPDVPIRLDSGAMIANLSRFVNAHLENVRCNNGKLTFLPYLERLREVRGMVNNAF